MRRAEVSSLAAGLLVGALIAVGGALAVVAVAVPIASDPRRISPAPSTPAATATTPTAESPRPLPTDSPTPTVASPSPTATPQIGIDSGMRAPDFQLLTPEGDPIALSDFLGQPVWINFWAPWCPACRTEMPRLEGFYAEHRDDGLVILGVGVKDSPEGMRAYAGEVGVSYPIAVDGDGAVASEYRALALPVHYWVDRDGVIRSWAFGELPPDLLAASLETILPPESPATP